MKTVDELIAEIPVFVQRLRDKDEWCPVQDRDIGEWGLDLPCYVNIDRFCFGGHDCDWDEVCARFDDIQSAANKEGAWFMQSDGDYRNYYMYITKPMTSEEISSYLATLEGPRAEGVRRHVAWFLGVLND
jgi:hypothetical protein